MIGLSKQLKDELEISREQRNLLEKQLENARIELTGKTEAIEAKELDNERLEAMLTDKEEKEVSIFLNRKIIHRPF